MTEQEYIAECKRLFGAKRYGWSTWEQEAAIQAYQEDMDADEAVCALNDSYVRRKADRNA